MNTLNILKGFAVLALMFGLFGRMLWQQRKAGGVIFVLDRNWLMTLLAGFVTMVFIVDHLRYRAETINTIIVILIWIINGVLISLGSRTEMRENGIWHNFSLICWSSIADYQWKEKPPVTLVIRLKNGPSSSEQKTYQIAAGNREFVDQELKRRVRAKEEPR